MAPGAEHNRPAFDHRSVSLTLRELKRVAAVIEEFETKSHFADVDPESAALRAAAIEWALVIREQPKTGGRLRRGSAPRSRPSPRG